ncbi:MAG: beta-galactosidase [Anaerolineae bacterium]|jgi:beta-galactosidase|nr:beta-galactosidase [Chloroflexota bacterium]
MISPKLQKIWYGGDYNPDQWSEEIWDEDMRLMQLAHVDAVSVPVFSWTHLQPREDQYCFDWLDRVLDKLAAAGVYTCLATSTAAQPAWMSRRFADVLRTDITGVQRKHGGRTNFCPNSPNYRHYSRELASRLAQRYANHPTLVAWHIANEYGSHCYCERCAKAFRDWLKVRYGSLDALNAAWNMAFWSHTLTAWEEIDTPTLNGERNNMPYLLDYERFQTESVLACYRNEYDAIKQYTPEVLITTNLMGHFKPLNYYAWAPYLDVISWDSYPTPNQAPSEVAFTHELMRGLRDGQPFMLLEQTPSQVNWMPRNQLRRPGVMRLLSYQAVAHGADTVMFFQFRRARGGPEKMHGSIVDHAGHEHTRVFREVQALGAELQQLGDALVDGRQQASVALLFDWENWWAIDLSVGPSVDLDYIASCKAYYAAFWQANIPVDVVRPDADLSSYQMVVAPMLYMLRPGVAANLSEFVARGGTLVVGSFSGIVDEHDLATQDGYPGELRPVLGIWVEEHDPLLEGQQVPVRSEPWGRLTGNYQASVMCDLLHLEGAQGRAWYDGEFYAGMPAITENAWGKGRALYVAAEMDARLLSDLLLTLCDQHDIAPCLAAPAGVEVTQRSKEGVQVTMLLNHGKQEAVVPLDAEYRDLLSGEPVQGNLKLAPCDVRILQRL